jgi:hypothetical protein
MPQTVLLWHKLSPAFRSKSARAGGITGVVLGEPGFVLGESGRRDALGSTGRGLFSRTSATRRAKTVAVLS